ncbi:MAG: hypothetical protein HUK17_04105 [Bacteroidales bacterium]|nr:hypothetical protein [Bacteroidales bacterium]
MQEDNTYNNKEQNAAPSTEEQQTTSAKKKWWSFSDMDWPAFALKQKWLILMIVGFCFVLNWNRYEVERLLKQKNALEKEIDFRKEQGVQMQKEYHQSVRISRIAKELDSLGVQFISGPPYEIE